MMLRKGTRMLPVRVSSKYTRMLGIIALVANQQRGAHTFVSFWVRLVAIVLVVGAFSLSVCVCASHSLETTHPMTTGADAPLTKKARRLIVLDAFDSSRDPVPEIPPNQEGVAMEATPPTEFDNNNRNNEEPCHLDESSSSAAAAEEEEEERQWESLVTEIRASTDELMKEQLQTFLTALKRRQLALTRLQTAYETTVPNGWDDANINDSTTTSSSSTSGLLALAATTVYEECSNHMDDMQRDIQDRLLQNQARRQDLRITLDQHHAAWLAQYKELVQRISSSTSTTSSSTTTAHDESSTIRCQDTPMNPADHTVQQQQQLHHHYHSPNQSLQLLVHNHSAASNINSTETCTIFREPPDAASPPPPNWPTNNLMQAGGGRRLSSPQPDDKDCWNEFQHGSDRWHAAQHHFSTQMDDILFHIQQLLTYQVEQTLHEAVTMILDDSAQLEHDIRDHLRHNFTRRARLQTAIACAAEQQQSVFAKLLQRVVGGATTSTTSSTTGWGVLLRSVTHNHQS
jgi:hypothetical protein